MAITKEITRAALEEKYLAMTTQALCEELQISRPTLYVLLKKAGIELKGQQGHAAKIRLIG